MGCAEQGKTVPLRAYIIQKTKKTLPYHLHGCASPHPLFLYFIRQLEALPLPAQLIPGGFIFFIRLFIELELGQHRRFIPPVRFFVYAVGLLFPTLYVVRKGKRQYLQQFFP